MSLLEKVRNFFYDDEYEEEIEPEKPKHKEKKEKFRIKEIKEEPKEKQEISERELFKAERTFNFPMDIEDEEEYEIPTRKNVIEEEKEEVKVVKPKVVETKEVSYTGIRDYAKYEEKKEERDAPKKFKPTPVISPIYGILDKNYKKEDLLMDANQEHETPKKVDYDTVRRKAYGNVYAPKEESKGIFYNLEEEKEEVEDTTFDDDDNDDVKIIYNDVTYDEDEKDDENVTIGEKIEAYEKEEAEDEEDNNDIDINSVYEDDDQILSETKEQDLFNLIDNMYNSEDEEEEEEE
ncbi:MAG: hypothetical protein J6O62_03750 [Bacilli bacterium]|nr:hypothetical protein [Bacilli bacterium]MBO6194825.1 hypothetical protein [Bacilli bacterium]